MKRHPRTVGSALVALVVSGVNLVAACLSFAASSISLAAVGVGALTERLHNRPRAVPIAAPTVPRSGQPQGGREALTSALSGLGFHAPAVRKFVAGLSSEELQRPMPELIKEGLRHLAS